MSCHYNLLHRESSRKSTQIITLTRTHVKILFSINVKSSSLCCCCAHCVCNCVSRMFRMLQHRLYTFEKGAIGLVLELNAVHQQVVSDFICMPEIAPFARHLPETYLLLYVLLGDRRLLVCTHLLE